MHDCTYNTLASFHLDGFLGKEAWRDVAHRHARTLHRPLLSVWHLAPSSEKIKPQDRKPCTWRRKASTCMWVPTCIRLLFSVICAKEVITKPRAAWVRNLKKSVGYTLTLSHLNAAAHLICHIPPLHYIPPATPMSWLQWIPRQEMLLEFCLSML